MEVKSDFERARLALLLGLGLAFGTLYLLVFLPFIASAVWSIVLVTATWPVYRKIKMFVHGRENLSAALMTCGVALLFLILFVPLIFVISKEIPDWGHRTNEFLDKLPEPSSFPIVGPLLENYGIDINLSRRDLLPALKRYQSQIIAFVSSAIGALFNTLTQFLVCLFISFFLYRDGSVLSAQVDRALIRIGGSRFHNLIQAIDLTVKSSVYGIFVTALIQGIFATIGYLVVRVEFPFLLGFLTGVCSLVPFASPLMYILISVSLFTNGSPVLSVFLLAWGIGFVGGSDNIVRSLFISHNSQNPVALVFMGIVGGVLAFGFLGLVLGPVIVAIGQELWAEWSNPESFEQKAKFEVV